MYSNTRLKIYALLFHFFIVVGMGHSIGLMGFVEIIGLGDLSEARFKGTLSSPFEDYIHTIALSSLAAQITMIASLLIKHYRIQLYLHLSALLLLWASVIYLLTAAEVTSGLHTSILFCIPLSACTIWPLFRLAKKPIGHINNWIDS